MLIEVVFFACHEFIDTAAAAPSVFKYKQLGVYMPIFMQIIIFFLRFGLINITSDSIMEEI